MTSLLITTTMNASAIDHKRPYNTLQLMLPPMILKNFMNESKNTPPEPMLEFFFRRIKANVELIQCSAKKGKGKKGYHIPWLNIRHKGTMLERADIGYATITCNPMPMHLQDGSSCIMQKTLQITVTMIHA